MSYSIASDTFWDLNKVLAKIDTADLARLALALKADPMLVLQCVENHIRAEMNVRPQFRGPRKERENVPTQEGTVDSN
jgi:hypothetical protein